MVPRLLNDLGPEEIDFLGGLARLSQGAGNRQARAGRVEVAVEMGETWATAHTAWASRQPTGTRYFGCTTASDRKKSPSCAIGR